jgi:CDP-glucose 4,6-dehydratase
LSGYLRLGALMATEDGDAFASAFNFGPGLGSNRSVSEVVEEFLKHTAGEWVDASDAAALHEAGKLNLATDRAFHVLGWQPIWNFEATVAMTASWYEGEASGGDVVELTAKQIREYVREAGERGVAWAI